MMAVWRVTPLAWTWYVAGRRGDLRVVGMR